MLHISQQQQKQQRPNVKGESNEFNPRHSRRATLVTLTRFGHIDTVTLFSQKRVDRGTIWRFGLHNGTD